MATMNKKERLALEKEQRLLGYRILIGTITREDRDRLQVIKARLAELQRERVAAPPDEICR